MEPQNNCVISNQLHDIYMKLTSITILLLSKMTKRKSTVETADIFYRLLYEKIFI